MAFTAYRFPDPKIDTRAAAEAILFLHRRFGSPKRIDAWIETLENQWPDLASVLLTAAKDE